MFLLQQVQSSQACQKFTIANVAYKNNIGALGNLVPFV